MPRRSQPVSAAPPWQDVVARGPFGELRGGVGPARAHPRPGRACSPTRGRSAGSRAVRTTSAPQIARGSMRCSRRDRSPLRLRTERALGGAHMSHEVKLRSADRVLFPDDGITKGDLFSLLRPRRRRDRPAPARPPVHDEALARRARGRRVLPEAGAEGHPRLDPDAPVPHVAARRQGRRVAAGRLPARRLARGAALDGADALHRHERVVLARRQARPPGLGALRPRSARGAGRVRAVRARRALRARRRSTSSGSSRT